jgi:hypothetical protein
MCGLLLSITWTAESLSRSKKGGTSTMRVLLQIAAALALVMMSASTHGQVGGNLAAGPPADVFLEIATSPDGEPVLSAREFNPGFHMG